MKDREGLTYKEIAGATDYGAEYVGQVVRGEQALSPAFAQAIEDAYGWRAAWLRFGEEPKRVDTAEPVYTIGEEPAEFDVGRRIVYTCGHCEREVAPRLPRCPHCGARLRWRDDQGR